MQLFAWEIEAPLAASLLQAKQLAEALPRLNLLILFHIASPNKADPLQLPRGLHKSGVPKHAHCWSRRPSQTRSSCRHFSIT